MNFLKYTNKIKEIEKPSKSIMNEIVNMNSNRIFYISIIAMPVSLLHIIFFLIKSPVSSEKEAIWRVGIIISHTVLFILMALLGGISFNLRKKTKPNLVMIRVQYIAIVVIIITGSIIVSIDQLVTSNITPFLVACTITGAIFLIRPLYSLLVFLSGYFIYFYALGFTQLEPSILLSNRVNGITAVGIGVCLSIIFWNYNLVNLQQRRYIECQQMELEEKNKQLEYISNFDPLTDLFNRRYFERRIENEISRIKRYGNESCLLILDLDNFKIVNDSFGHPIGDSLLKSIATLLSKQLRESDLISRLGGEEFAILLVNTNLDQGKSVAEKIRVCIENQIFIIEGHEINITISIGVSSLNNNIDSFGKGYRNADKALYSAKSNGRNRVEII